MGLDPDATFVVPGEVAEGFRRATDRGRAARRSWEARMAGAGERSTLLLRQLAGDHGEALDVPAPTFDAGTALATRRAFGICLAASAPHLPSLVAGAADLTENTGTMIPGSAVQAASSPVGAQVHYGVREHAMGSIMTGMALHGGVLPVGGTFFVFSDYLRPAIRVAAISRAKVVYVFTHDSIGVGEDGPTHQPIEQLASLRAMPDLEVFRPADANETSAAWRLALTADGPVALVLSRQDVPVLPETATAAGDGVAFGAYVVREVGAGELVAVVIGTGSEVATALEGAALAAQDLGRIRVVSMPSMVRFLTHSAEERARVLPDGVPVVSVEAASTFGWGAIADEAIGIDRFGESAPAAAVFADLGITPTAVALAVASAVARA
jgi:transketolase